MSLPALDYSSLHGSENGSPYDSRQSIPVPPRFDRLVAKAKHVDSLSDPNLLRLILLMAIAAFLL